jgi:signal transduction histidine kinase
VENGALKLGYLVPSNGESNYAKTIGIDPSGHVVLGLERGDFLAFDPAQPDRKWAIKAASPFRAHTAWFDRGSLLFGGTQGLVRVAGNRLQQIDAAGHPWLSEVSGIVRTPRGETWMIGAKGVVRTRSADIDAAFDRPGQPLPMELLDIRDGLPGPMQFGQREAALGGDGRVWFLTTQGVAWVDPAHMAVNRVMPPVVIRSILAGGRRYAAEDGLRLPKGTSRIQIDYTALSLSIPERVRFLYRLEGVDSDWVDPGARRQVFYTNLAPGHYRFQVIAANNDGVWNRTGASVAFEILPYFWQTWWFALLCVLASVACLAFLYRLRMRQVASRLRERLEERLEERERIARELHDTLLQSVQGLLLHFHSVADRIPPNEPTRGLMERTLERADDILIEGRERVRGLRFSEDGEDLPQVLHEIVARAALAIPVRVRIEGEPGAVHPLVVEEISRIGSEALFNIGRHAAASSAEIRLAFDPRHLSVSFSDDGVGIAREVLDAGGREGHFGLPGMRERVAKLRGEFRVQSRPGVGTEIRLTIPARTAYARSRWLWASRLFGLFGRKG